MHNAPLCGTLACCKGETRQEIPAGMLTFKGIVKIVLGEH